ncbi:hypothetical protein M9H77_26956 [Catharanthus roseus]|uniref:Uncharacterized protein n=1 Tax=Catharanthus roseus TaxID=4058 RepID=A0ACC0AFD7_CATRO|nr:hypothetical protein M9H77_26956 [Catharanthus roseus]
MDNTPSRLGHIPRTYSTRSEHSFISPLIEENDYVPYRVSTSQVSERDENNHHVEKVFKNKENIVKGEQIISLHKRIDILLQKLEKSPIESSGKKALLVKAHLQPPPEIKDYKLKTIEELKDSLEILFIESNESEEITSESEIDQKTNHSEDSEHNTCPCKQGNSDSENDTQEEDYYKLISQFRDSDINVLKKYEFSKISYYIPRFIWRN